MQANILATAPNQSHIIHGHASKFLKQNACEMWALLQENLTLGFQTRTCSNKPAQLHRLARLLNFFLVADLDMILSESE